MDVCVVKGMPKRRVLSVFPSVYRGRQIDSPDVNVFRTEAVFAQSLGPMALYADGDFLANTPVRLEVVPKHLKIIGTPQPA